jgi:hypothetical protein
LPGVVAMRPGAGYAELELAPGTEPTAVLAAVLARGVRVTRYELAEPSLEAIFIEKVGRPAGDDATLAADGPNVDLDAASDPDARHAIEGAA